ncbi:MAG: hypothetical protein IRD7MM_00465 [Candidatus Midichloria mitochondrii]|nr:hypothetical protein [Candidatus Midichloria mitochondrii]
MASLICQLSRIDNRLSSIGFQTLEELNAIDKIHNKNLVSWIK